MTCITYSHKQTYKLQDLNCMVFYLPECLFDMPLLPPPNPICVAEKQKYTLHSPSSFISLMLLSISSVPSCALHSIWPQFVSYVKWTKRDQIWSIDYTHEQTYILQDLHSHVSARISIPYASPPSSEPNLRGRETEMHVAFALKLYKPNVGEHERCSLMCTPLSPLDL